MCRCVKVCFKGFIKCVCHTPPVFLHGIYTRLNLRYYAVYTSTHGFFILTGADILEIYDKSNKGYIEVWLTNQEQQIYDRIKITEKIVEKHKKCKVVFFLSGKDDLFRCTENLLTNNI